MQNSWNLMGWFVIGCVALAVLLFILLLLLGMVEKFRRLRRHWKTRDIPPAKGQRWMQEGSILEIGDSYPKGHFSVSTGPMGMRASWGETPEAWKKRVYSRKLYLLEDGE